MFSSYQEVELFPEVLPVVERGDERLQRLPVVLPGPKQSARAGSEAPFVKVPGVEGDAAAAQLLLEMS